MARIAGTRAPAAPTDRSQAARRARILEAAADLATRHDLDNVQMQDVARDAGVAIGTVYRYFPSKSQLFAAVMAEEVFGPEPPRFGADAGSEVANLLIAWTGRIAGRPRLAGAMVHATLNEYARPTAQAREMDLLVAPQLLDRLGVAAPSEDDLTRIRLLLYSWWGITISHLSGHMTAASAEQHILMATALLTGAR